MDGRAEVRGLFFQASRYEETSELNENFLLSTYTCIEPNSKRILIFVLNQDTKVALNANEFKFFYG